MKVVSTEALTKLIQLVKSAFISVDDTVETSEVELLDIVASKDLSNITQATKSDVTSWGMPSDSYIDITLGSSGSTYTAPANGYIFLTKTTGNSVDQACQLFVNGSGRTDCIYMSSMTTHPTQSTCSTWVPVKKNDVITYAYTASGSLAHFRFIYAQGEI